jgi:hypothetical protein
MASTWKCSSCNRNVPQQLDVCRCGMPRPRAVPGAPAAAKEEGFRDLLNSWDFVGLLVALAVALSLGAYEFFRKEPPTHITPVLGYVSRPMSPSPTPRAAPTPRPLHR